MSDLVMPPVAAERRPGRGRGLVGAVIRRIEAGETADETVTDPAPELVVRESTAAPHGFACLMMAAAGTSPS